MFEDLQLADVVLFFGAAYAAIGTLYYLAIGAVTAVRYLERLAIRARLKRRGQKEAQRLEA